MKSFSQRKGIKPVSEIIQTDGMSDELRNSLWNVLDNYLWSRDYFLFRQHGEGEIENFSKALWSDYFKLPIDSRPKSPIDILAGIRKYFFQADWNEAYDLLEWIVQYVRGVEKLPMALNLVLEREMSGYRIISGIVTDITTDQEVEMLEETLRDSRFEATASHLRRALELLSNRDNPDYRNSIKESISAVESIARIVTGDPKATLGDALKALEKNGKLHPALRDGFLKLYGYTSDEDGIRHAMLERPTITASDAKYFLLSCTSFVNYLKVQMK